MDNKLTQDYKDNLYEKVLEKKARRTANRKRLASICVVFFIVACFATYGYTKYEKENYNNYFLTESENIYIDDEYEYFDDLGIKLEFINTDKDSITIGVNIKYEDIANSFVSFDNVLVFDNEKNDLLIEMKDENGNLRKNAWKNLYKIINKDTMQYIVCFENNSNIDIKKMKVIIKDCIIENKINKKILNKNVFIEKEISIEN